jgi:nitronate monooxygenase
MRLARIIQGGMGAGVSNWELARTVSCAGQLGVVSGTGAEAILAARLQVGDPGGHVRRALSAYPDSRVAERIAARYFSELPAAPRSAKWPSAHLVKDREALAQETIVANFVEVFLAKEGHQHPVGINLLTKIQLPVLASLYGAMLAGVDYVIMGAGIPREIPGILDRLSRHEDVSLSLDVEGASVGEEIRASFSPLAMLRDGRVELRRPAFFPIVSSNALASTMIKKTRGRVDGLVIEGFTAGGHNAPPRGELQLDENGEPVYGARDRVDLARIRDLGVPFYLAGGFGKPGKLREALDEGAAGVQVGTLFAFCRESGLLASLKRAALKLVSKGVAKVVTDAFASPTGYPFKVLQLEGTLAEPSEYEERPRACDFGLLRRLYKKEEGGIGYRCPAEPEVSWLAKGGAAEELEGRKCLCNALMANLGLRRERRSGYVEKPLLTVGDSFNDLKSFLAGGDGNYSARDVIAYLLRGLVPQT